jgi:predicted extracellular nuclease
MITINKTINKKFNTMKTKTLFALAFAAVILFSCSVRKQNTGYNDAKKDVQLSCVAFYNLENLFDTIHQTNRDEEYLPSGKNKWNTLKYNSKLRNMARAISEIGSDRSPAGPVILGVAEIENRGVLEDLVKQPAIANRQYQIVHYDSPDRRGIDVGLLYNPRYFLVSSSKSFRLNYPADTAFRTRDQLLVSGYLQDEKVHVIVNHWPSRTGGEVSSRPLRNAAAALTRSIVDSLFRADAKAKIIVMGDLNDDPFNESCAVIMAAKKDRNDVKPGEMFNVFWKTLESGAGSLAYNGRWNLFDQIIISDELLHGNTKKLHFWKSEIFYRDFLIQQEGQYKGTPFRTHAGGVWLNGYSDHLPTLIYLIKEI